MKTYRTSQNVGTAKYIVTFCDGIKRHLDGSHFADMRLFKSKVTRNAFIASLKKDGFKLL